MKTIVAMFNTTLDAQNGVLALEHIGVAPKDVSLLVAENATGEHFKVMETNKAAQGAVGGGVVGGLLGALAGTLVAIGIIVAPGVGLVAAGPVIAALAGAGAGAAGGSLVGGLVGMGIPEHEAKAISERVTRGGVLLAVTPRDEEDANNIRDALRKSGATSLSNVSQAA